MRSVRTELPYSALLRLSLRLIAGVSPPQSITEEKSTHSEKSGSEAEEIGANVESLKRPVIDEALAVQIIGHEDEGVESEKPDISEDKRVSARLKGQHTHSAYSKPCGHTFIITPICRRASIRQRYIGKARAATNPKYSGRHKHRRRRQNLQSRSRCVL